MKVILNNDPSDYYAKLSPVYKYSINIGTKIHKNMLSAILCNSFMFLDDAVFDELFSMFNDADPNTSIQDLINNVVKIKEKYNLIFKTMPDLQSLLVEVFCKRFGANELLDLENLVKNDEYYTFYDSTGLLGSNNTTFSLDLWDKILHIMSLIGDNEVYIIQELERQ